MRNSFLIVMALLIAGVALSACGNNETYAYSQAGKYYYEHDNRFKENCQDRMLGQQYGKGCSCGYTYGDVESYGKVDYARMNYCLHASTDFHECLCGAQGRKVQQ